MEYLRKLHLKKNHKLDVATMKFNNSQKNQVVCYSIFRDNLNEVENTKIRKKNKQMMAYQKLYCDSNSWRIFRLLKA